ncbi:MAG: energy-coupling factor transporter transmembrane protein EcfT [Methanobacteriota archaeon]|nr:MAG: energy-coupling factor transporter transmembrane protein EcfT [Euryarchaeota archaeon]
MIIKDNRRALKLNPVTKLSILVTVSVLVLLTSSQFTILVIVVSVLAAKQWTGTKGRFTKGVMGFALAIFITQMLFNRTGDEIASMWIVSITTGGVDSGVTIAGKFLILIMMSWIFVATTKPSKLSSSLIGIKVPYRYAFLPALAIRFVPIFELELNSVREAQVVRGLKLDRSFKGLIRSARYTVLPMFFSAMHKVNSLAASMTGRGFGVSRRRTQLHQESLSMWDMAITALAVVIAALLLLLDRCYEVPTSFFV